MATTKKRLDLKESEEEAAVLQPGYAEGLNTMLRLATSGAFTDIEQVIRNNIDMTNNCEKLNTQIQSIQEELTKAEAKARASHFLKEVKLEAKAETTVPAGKVTSKLASDVFIKSALLNFEVTFFEWEHEHPEVPRIDPNYIFNAEALITFLYALVNNKNTWFHGHTGTGKTTFVEQVAARLGWPVVRVNLDNDIERGDFLGQTQLVTGASGATESKFVEGVLPRAMQNPAIFLIDEMDFGKSGIMYVLQRALESKGLLMTEDGGRLIEPHPFFRIAATANTRGQGDELGCYPGARTQSNALLDRFTVWINVDYMTSKEEADLLKATFPKASTDLIDQLVSFAKEIRTAFTNRELLQAISPRSLLSILGSHEFYSQITDPTTATKLAIKSCYLQRATSDTVVKVNEIATRCIKGVA